MNILTAWYFLNVNYESRHVFRDDLQKRALSKLTVQTHLKCWKKNFQWKPFFQLKCKYTLNSIRNSWRQFRSFRIACKIQPAKLFKTNGRISGGSSFFAAKNKTLPSKRLKMFHHLVHYIFQNLSKQVALAFLSRCLQKTFFQHKLSCLSRFMLRHNFGLLFLDLINGNNCRHSFH